MANAKYSALRAPIKSAFATCRISAFFLGAVVASAPFYLVKFWQSECTKIKKNYSFLSFNNTYPNCAISKIYFCFIGNFNCCMFEEG